MDNLAHTLIGVGVARAGLSRKYGPGTTATLAIASNLPDVDILWTFWDPIERFVLRRTHSHSLVALPVLAAALSLVVWWRRRERPWKTLFGLSALGVALHLAFDLVNAFGVVLLWPFSDRRLELACVFIVDPFVWSVMGVPLIVAGRLTTDAARLRLWRGAVALLLVYAVTCLGAQQRAELIVRRDLGAAAPFRLFPEPLGPFDFRAAQRTGDVWRIYRVRPFEGTMVQADLVTTDTEHPDVAAVRATPAGRRLEWFMAAPAWRRRDDGTIEVEDLRFATLRFRSGPTFLVEFRPGDPTPRPR